jgi:hypothetical protein
MKSKYLLCDHACPLSEQCARYCPTMDRRRTFHIDPSPYKDGKCSHFEEKEEEDDPLAKDPAELN